MLHVRMYTWLRLPIRETADSSVLSAFLSSASRVEISEFDLYGNGIAVIKKIFSWAALGLSCLLSGSSFPPSDRTCDCLSNRWTVPHCQRCYGCLNIGQTVHRCQICLKSYNSSLCKLCIDTWSLRLPSRVVRLDSEDEPIMSDEIISCNLCGIRCMTPRDRLRWPYMECNICEQYRCCLECCFGKGNFPEHEIYEEVRSEW